MPTTFTHDLFGREVYRKLPASLQALIREHGDLYRIGQHGPDILFYYRILKNRINQTGTKMHREPAKPFFTHGLKIAREEQDEALLVYLLGFACHFMLDSTCHPYIGTLTDEGVVSHGKIEKEYDRFLMEKEGLNPYHFYPSKCITATPDGAKTIHKAIPEISYPTIFSTLRWMKCLTNLMVYDDNGRKQKVILPLLHVIGLGDGTGDNFMRKDADPACLPMIDRLEALFEKAVSDAVPMLLELYRIYREGGEVPERFDRDYELSSIRQKRPIHSR